MTKFTKIPFILTALLLPITWNSALVAAGKNHRGLASNTGATATSQGQTQAQNQERIWVGKNDTATSCNINSGISLDEMSRDLGRGAIKVFEKKKVPDSQPRIAMCGVDKGTVNGFLILKKDLPKAEALGFKAINP